MEPGEKEVVKVPVSLIWKGRPGRVPWSLVAVVMLGLGSAPAAESLFDQTQLLCVPVQATVCTETGEFVVDLPWNVNLPQIIEADLDERMPRTTPSSGENRASSIEDLEAKKHMVKF